jgi:hypothetical protein
MIKKIATVVIMMGISAAAHAGMLNGNANLVLGQQDLY